MKTTQRTIDYLGHPITQTTTVMPTLVTVVYATADGWELHTLGEAQAHILALRMGPQRAERHAANQRALGRTDDESLITDEFVERLR